MKFLADVNIPFPLITILRKNGHKVIDARVDYPQAKDIELIKIAQDKNLIILTKDRDFFELIKYPQYKTPLIIIRLKNQVTDNMIKFVTDLLNHQDERILTCSITIVTEVNAQSFDLEEYLLSAG